jgi:tetratricopeptide (TPR) repeat protein
VGKKVDAAIHNSLACLTAGRREHALACLCVVQTADERNAPKSNLIGLIYLSAGENVKALAWFDRALHLDGACAEAWSNRGAALQQLGHAEALSAYEEAVRLGLSEPALFYNRGNLLREAGRFEEAIVSYDTALKLKPAYPEALRAGGIVLRDLGHPRSALEFFDEAIRLRPTFVEASIDRGNLLQNLDRFEEALACYDRALEHNPDHSGLLNNRGSALQAIGRLREASAAFDAALRSNPLCSKAWSNRGNLLLMLQQPEASLAAYDRALAIRPDYVDALSGRAVALKRLCRFDEALADFDAALALDPTSAHIKNNKAALLLLLGDFERGWDLYEWRWIAGQTPKNTLKLAIPEWDGQPLAGRKIIVFDEQGLGDAIQFARYLLLLSEAGAHVAFFCRSGLRRLLKGLAKPIALVDNLTDVERFDYQIALCSLPRALKTTLATIPAAASYLVAERPLVQKWAAQLGSRDFKIGVCWRGSANLKADAGRAPPLDCFASLAHKGARLISLQKFDPSLSQSDSGGVPDPEKLRPPENLPQAEDLGADFDAGMDRFIDAAAVMQSLDLIITCDTSIAHLAGALGRPVWVVLQHSPDWRWLLHRDDCPWYPSMRLFRQSRRGDWAGVFDSLGQALQITTACARPPCN